MPERSEPASQHQMQAFFDNLVAELDKVEFLRPAEKRDTMLVNLRNIFTRMDPTKQDMHTPCTGVVMAIAGGPQARPRAACSTAPRATRLRALLAEQGQARRCRRQQQHRPRPGPAAPLQPDRRRADPVALTKDRRFAGQFARQTPVGRHILDFVSFVDRIAIELVNPDESDATAADRADAGRRRHR